MVMIHGISQIFEIKELIRFGLPWSLEKRGPQNEGKSEYVIENKPRKNVHFRVCVYVVDNKIG